MSQIQIDKIVAPMKGSVVSTTIDNNFRRVVNVISDLEDKVDKIKNIADLIDRGGATSGSVVSVNYSPTTITAKKSSTEVTYTIDVQVMLGQKELIPGTDNSLTQFSYELASKSLVDGGYVVATVEDVITSNKLSFVVTIAKNATSDVDLVFTITFGGISYVKTVPIVIVSSDSDIDFAQGIFVSTIFKRSNDSLTAPEGGTYKLPMPTTIDGSGELYQGWSDGIPSGGETLWTCHRKFTSDGSAPQESNWSTPIQAIDSADFDVAFHSGSTMPSGKPLYHHQEDQGNGWHDTASSADTWMGTCVKTGNVWGDWNIVRVKGENGIASSWKNTIYKKYDGAEGPQTPTGRTIDFIDSSLITDPTDPNYDWHDTPNDTGMWWMSCAYINGETNELDSDSSWSKPIAVAGTGQGVFLSTIFKRSENIPSTPEGGNFSSPLPDPLDGWSDGIPEKDGTSNPIWQTHRIFSSNGATPQEDTWHTPIKMIDTADFDCCYNSGTTMPHEPEKHGDQSANNDIYGWHNEGTTADTWMATSHRTTSSDDWSAWTITKIKGEDGNDADFMNYIFKRNDTASGITEPNIMNPNHFVGKERGEVTDDSGRLNTEERNQDWKDGPGGSGVWWMSCGLCDGTTGVLDNTTWSTPIKMTGEKGSDGSYTDYEYSVDDNEIYHPSSGWEKTVSGAIVTYCEAHGISPIPEEVPSNTYMWMRMQRWTNVNGKLTPSNWEYARITGEKGEAGTKLKIKGKCDSFRELFLKSVDEDNNPLPDDKLPNDGDSYTVNQEMWVWSDSVDWEHTSAESEAKYGTDLDPAKWQSCGNIAGPSGATMYLHIKYADILDRTSGSTKYPSDAYDTPTDKTRYIGVYSSTGETAAKGDEAYRDLYKWSNFKGSDGYGYEYIYKLWTSVTPPDVPTSANTPSVTGADWETDFQNSDFVPSGWTDNPSGISDDYPYEYMAKRVRNENGVWQQFTGKANNLSEAILYGYKGKNAPYEERQWRIFTKLVLDEADKDPDLEGWLNYIPIVTPEKNEYVWRRERTVTPEFGDTASATTAWQFVRITGEQGNNGTGIQLAGSLDTLLELFKLAYTSGASIVYDESKVENGTAYTVSGELWTWSSSNIDYDDSNVKTYSGISVTDTDGYVYWQHHWRNGGNIKGEKGDSFYLYVKYADKALFENGKYIVNDASWLTHYAGYEDGELPGRYRGEAHGTSKTDTPVLADYVWYKNTGDDGIDYEYIYTRTSDEIDVHVPYFNDAVFDKYFSGDTTIKVVKSVDSGGTPTVYQYKKYQDNDFVPCIASKLSGDDGTEYSMTTYNWTDNPMGPSESLPYEWCAKRKKENGIWQIYNGKADNLNYAFLYNKYGDSALQLEMEPNQYVFAKTSDGYAQQLQEVVVSFTASKDGEIRNITDIKYSGDTAGLSLTVTTGSSANCIISIPQTSFLYNGGLITFELTIDKESLPFHKKFQYSLGGSDGKSSYHYEVISDPAVIKVDGNGNRSYDENDEITFLVNKIEGGSIKSVNMATETSLKLKYAIDGSSTYSILPISDYYPDRRCIISTVADIANNKINVKLLETSGSTDFTRALLSIPVTKDGASGSSVNQNLLINSSWNLQNFSGSSFLNSAIPSGYTYPHSAIKNSIVSGKTYTLSVKGKVNGTSNSYVDIFISPRSSSKETDWNGAHWPHIGTTWAWLYSYGKLRFNFSNQSQIKTLIFTAPDNYDFWFVDVYTYNNGLFDSEWVKLEEGSVATSWCENNSVSYYQSNIFKRSQTQLSTPEGGSFDSPLPSPLNDWSDGIPSGTYPIYTSKCKFGTDGSTTKWSTPIIMSDNADFDVAYHSGTTKPEGLPTTHGTEQQGNGWHNTGTSDDYWMATSNRTAGGSWSDWVVTKIKGEDGDDAIGYSIVPSNSQIGVDASGHTKVSYLSFVANKISGSTVTPITSSNIESDIKIEATYDNSSTYTSATYNIGAKLWMIPSSIFTGATKCVNIRIATSTNSVLASVSVPLVKDGANGTDGVSKTSKPLRGPRTWAEGVEYQGGGDGDDFQDIVLVSGNTKTMYLCHVKHTSSASTLPSSSYTDKNWTASKPWSETAYVEFTATKVLFSEKASIDNLVVNNVFIQDDYGNTLVDMSSSGVTLNVPMTEAFTDLNSFDYETYFREHTNFSSFNLPIQKSDGTIEQESTWTLANNSFTNGSKNPLFIDCNKINSVYIGDNTAIGFNNIICLPDSTSYNVDVDGFFLLKEGTETDEYCLRYDAEQGMAALDLEGYLQYNTTAYKTAGTHLTISYGLIKGEYYISEEDSNLWAEQPDDFIYYAYNETSYDYKNNYMSRIFNTAIMVLASPNVLAGADIQSSNEGSFFLVNGCRSKAILMLPGQNLKLTSTLNNGQIYWVVDNASDYEKLHKRYRAKGFDQTDFTTQTNSFIRQGSSSGADAYSNKLFGPHYLNSDLYVYQNKNKIQWRNENSGTKVATDGGDLRRLYCNSLFYYDISDTEPLDCSDFKLCDRGFTLI